MAYITVAIIGCLLFASFCTICCAFAGSPDNNDLGGIFGGAFLIAEIICAGSYICFNNDN